MVITLVPEAFFYSLLASIATRTASFILFLLARSGSALRSALRVANFQIKKIVLKESLWDQGSNVFERPEFCCGHRFLIRTVCFARPEKFFLLLFSLATYNVVLARTCNKVTVA